MIKNYLKIAWRNLKKNRLYTIINVIGLTIGIVSCLLIGIYIRHELSYDRFNKNADKIVRVVMDYNFGTTPQKAAVTGTKVGPQFRRTFPEVADFVRLYKKTETIGYKDRLFREHDVLYADASFFNIFSFNLLRGNADNAIDAPGKVIISQTAAKKYFTNEDPIGRFIKISGKDFLVSGIAADPPSNSQVSFDFVVPFSNLNASKKEKWGEANYATYLLLKNKHQVPFLQGKIAAYMKIVDKDELKITGSQYLTFGLEPLTLVHLYSNLPGGLEPNGSITYVYILVVVALLILIIACVNYVNLSIAQSVGRSAEIGIRKVLGAAKFRLFMQFIGESFLTVTIAVMLAFGVSFLLIPVLNQISGKHLYLNVLFDPFILIGLIILGILIGFSAGAYPALLL